MLLAGIAVAGALGALARYGVDAFVIRRARGGLPAATLTINVSGSFLLGVITGAALYHAFPSTPRTILGTGFCGAFTTFSTFAYEVVALAEERLTRAAIWTLVLSLVVPVTAAALGLTLASL